MISATGSAPLAAAVLAYRAADRDLKKRLSDETKRTVIPGVLAAVRYRTRTHRDTVVYADTGALGGNPPGVRIGGRRKIGDGRARTAGVIRMVEFGTDAPGRTSTYVEHRRGGPVRVTRATRMGLPPRTPSGRVAYPALANAIPRACAAWVLIIARAYAPDGGTGG